MGIVTTVPTEFGADMELYMRINNAEISNHGVDSHFIFRGYVSEQAYREGHSFVKEETISFVVDVSGDIWQQAYDKFQEKYPQQSNAN